MSFNLSGQKNKINKLVLSGGGLKGVALLGGLHYLEEKGYLGNIDEYWGTSIGSVICTLLLIGYSPFEIFHQLFIMDNFADVRDITFEDIIKNKALCPIEMFGEKVLKIIQKKIGKNTNPTFFDLYDKYKIKIHIMGSNVDTMKGECFDVNTYPFMKIIEAIEISCDLPYIFTPKKFNGHNYVDGGFINNYPIDMADNGRDIVLGLCVFDETVNNKIGWLYRLISMPILELYRLRTKNLSEKCINIKIVINNINILELAPSRKKKLDIFSVGYNETSTQINKLEKEKLDCIMKYNKLVNTNDEIGRTWNEYS